MKTITDLLYSLSTAVPDKQAGETKYKFLLELWSITIIIMIIILIITLFKVGNINL